MVSRLPDIRARIRENNRYRPTPAQLKKAKRRVMNMGGGITRTIPEPGDIVINEAGIKGDSNARTTTHDGGAKSAVASESSSPNPKGENES